MRLLRCFVVAGGISVASMVGPPRARADGPPRRVVVVDVDAEAVQIDAASLREAIGVELGADALPAGDPRASNASGEIRVSVDRETGKLVVAYRAGAGSIERRIDLGPDRAANERSAVLLAGNLARDEAGDLVAALRKKAIAAAPASQPPALPQSSSTTATDDEVDYWDDDRLEQTLVRHAEADRGLRLGVGWVFLGLGAAAIGGGAYWATRVDSSGVGGPFTAIGAGAALSGAALISLLTPSVFEDLRQYHDADRATGRPLRLVREDVERLWTSYANAERARRRRARWFLVGAAAIFVGLGVGDALNWGAAPHNAVNLGAAALPFAAGSTLFLFGWPLLLSGPGPIESRLRSYQESAMDAVVSRGEFL